jgi:malate dehydrogenase (oxaloacetate-decarboxylating)
MMLSAARAFAGNSPALKNSSASLLPPLTDIRRVAAEIATAVGMEAQKEGVAPKLAEDELSQQARTTQWTPAYLAFESPQDVTQILTQDSGSKSAESKPSAKLQKR